MESLWNGDFRQVPMTGGWFATGFSAEALCADAGYSNAELLHPGLQCGSFHTERRRCAVWSGDYPVRALERGDDLLPLGVVEHRTHIGRNSTRTLRRDRRLTRPQITARNVEDCVLGEDHRPLDYILQLANVSRPRILRRASSSYPTGSYRSTCQYAG